jgi:23S rRNA pseudouridine2604 synthase
MKNNIGENNMKINQYISMNGHYSRRKIDSLIKKGKVTINSKVCRHHGVVLPNDLVQIDGKVIENIGKPIYLILNKPVGITCTAQKTVDSNIIDYMNYPHYIFPVGRLDKDSDGLIIMTNDGEISNKILRSEMNHEKEYIVTVDQPITEAFMEGMAKGVEILSTKTKPCQVARISDYVFRIILTQGLNRQIRRMCKMFGYRVLRLQRIRIMNLTMDGLEIGQWRELNKLEVSELMGRLQANNFD